MHCVISIVLSMRANASLVCNPAMGAIHCIQVLYLFVLEMATASASDYNKRRINYNRDECHLFHRVQSGDECHSLHLKLAPFFNQSGTRLMHYNGMLCTSAHNTGIWG